ncbi:MAG: myo-inosose-2 dehydratase [Elusimicrobia bacterium]|nr:myo-inosose-2 dehydratase [Candidatus Obscuribacterium magneticum]
MLKGLNIKIGAQPIIWSNDDFLDLGADTSLEQCLGEMKEAGYAGTELGHKFPSNITDLKNVLQKHELSLVSGWHSTYLLSTPLEEEKHKFQKHLDRLSQLNCSVAIVAECTGRIYDDPKKALWKDSRAGGPGRKDWDRLFNGLDELAKLASAKNMTLVYHHHMGTIIQNLPEIDRLMANTKDVRLLADTGHMAFAGIDPAEVFQKYKHRISHVHLKNIRPEVVELARKGGFSFADAVRKGVFTVPGDGGIDYLPIFKTLAGISYNGWMVVEAEQDPLKAEPLKYAKMGREYIRRTAGI